VTILLKNLAAKVGRRFDMPALPQGNDLTILYHHRVGSKDGQGVHIESLIAALRRAGHKVHLVAPPAFSNVDFGGQSRSFSLLKRLLPGMVYELLEVCYNLPALYRLELAYRRVRPDLIYERYNLFMLAGVLLARLHGKPIFLEVNAPLARERAAHDSLVLTRFAAWLERCTWRTADFVLPVSHVLAKTVKDAGVPPEQIVVIPNGIEEQYLATPPSADAKLAFGLPGKTVLGFVGFVREWHGLEDVIDLLADRSCPESLHFAVVGDGPALMALRERAERLGITARVTFSGLIDRDGVAQRIRAFDVALQPRAVDYASPLKLFEYMACGKAIVAPNQPNIREILLDGENARLFDPMEKGAFREAVLELAADEASRQRLGAAARRTILTGGYTWADNARRITALYQDQRQSQPKEEDLKSQKPSLMA
jgi:glycosyltransferase involved in cell wall biosynthesis